MQPTVVTAVEPAAAERVAATARGYEDAATSVVNAGTDKPTAKVTCIAASATRTTIGDDKVSLFNEG